ncbi:MAG: IS110 family transposase [Actinomycetota bacterium]|nr:IS110 family transposase [Actinomycetota bacterium]
MTDQPVPVATAGAVVTADEVEVVAGVDTHGQTHHVAVLTTIGGELGDREFPATAAGYAALLAWVHDQGRLLRVGVEGTSSYGAGLARHLHDQDVAVVEIDRPDRRARRHSGKSDPLDAYAAARAALAGTRVVVPKTGTGIVEAIRVIRVTRRSAVKARTQTTNQLRSLLVTAPTGLREQLAGLKTPALVTTCARLRIATADLSDPARAVRVALRRLARRHQQLTAEIRDADRELRPLITAAAPTMTDRLGVNVEVAGQLLTTVGDNPDRMRSEAAFAHLCGVAPIPASSGRTRRHRLNRGGDRAANNAVYTVVLTRLRLDERTRAYVTRRTREGLSKREIIRCLQRYVARELYQLLVTLPASSSSWPTPAVPNAGQP